MKTSVSIPNSQLSQELVRVAELKREALALLLELETAYLLEPPVRPGEWRQETSGFIASKR